MEEKKPKSPLYRRLIAGILALFTFVGGHYYNRRPDKAVFFFGLMVVWAISVYAGISWYMWHITAANTPHLALTRIFQAFMAGTSLIYLASALTTLFDSVRVPPPAAVRSLTARLAALMITLAGTAICYSQFYVVYNLMGRPGHFRMHTEEGTDVSRERRWHDTDFTQYIYYGHGSSAEKEGPEPPEGAGLLTGRIFYGGKPAAGVGMRLYLDGKYRSKKLVSDAEGRVSLPLEKRKWSLDLVVTDGWQDRPAAGSRFIVLTGKESPLRHDRGYHLHTYREKGLEVDLEKGERGDDFMLTIRDTMKITEPEAGAAGTVSVSDGVIAWTPYEGAARYLVQISRVERESARSITHYPVAQKVVEGAARIPLGAFETEKNNGKSSEYHASIFAFGEDNAFLTQSEDLFGDALFKLDEEIAIADNIKPYAFNEDDAAGTERPAGSMADIVARLDADKRVNAVEVLIEGGLLDEAGRLLDQIDEAEAGPGKKEALRGYMLAKRGDCKAAAALFDKAKAKECCIPASYRAACPSGGE